MSECTPSIYDFNIIRENLDRIRKENEENQKEVDKQNSDEPSTNFYDGPRIEPYDDLICSLFKVVPSQWITLMDFSEHNLIVNDEDEDIT